MRPVAVADDTFEQILRPILKRIANFRQDYDHTTSSQWDKRLRRHRHKQTFNPNAVEASVLKTHRRGSIIRMIHWRRSRASNCGAGSNVHPLTMPEARGDLSPVRVQGCREWPNEKDLFDIRWLFNVTHPSGAPKLPRESLLC